MRVLVTGMGGELGTRVAQLLETRPEVDEIAGFDFMPPRRRLRRATFKRIDPRDRDRLIGFVTDFAPHAVAHFGVYEPGSRMGSREAAASTEACTVNALGAAQRAGHLGRIAVRSGLEVYGRGRGHPLVPDEEAPLAPTTPYGRTCLEVESLALGIGRRHDVPVGALRYAVVAGSHIPSPRFATSSAGPTWGTCSPCSTVTGRATSPAVRSMRWGSAPNSSTAYWPRRRRRSAAGSESVARTRSVSSP